MTRFLPAWLFALGVSLTGLSTVDGKAAPAAAAAKSSVQITLSKDPAGKTPAASFGPADAAIYLFFEGDSFKKGDKIQAAWFIVDGGKTIDKNFKVSEGTQTAQREKDKGYLSIARPAAGWPAGKWRVDVSLNGARVGSYPFTVTK